MVPGDIEIGGESGGEGSKVDWRSHKNLAKVKTG